ncbi:MAG: UDP-N-acetylglucosamine--undecaprenyl-phosphate N-acetylglucosaminephosphotransferase [Firmicutes bacterium]|nr:UDP-N-acetylglucosamine--undecaprenyl-phosphate N-acetylglucosaminephosphotransferase [Bacillota bacterium]
MSTVQILSLLVCFALTAICLRALRPAAYRFDLIDQPCNRKRHRTATPLLGGISIFIGFLCAALIGAETSYEFFSFLLAAGFMVVLGVIDDRHDISAKTRLAAQAVIASLLIFSGDMTFTTLGDLLGVGELQLGLFAIPFTYLAILAAINAFNMIDGIDGLLGGVALLCFAAIGVLALLHGAYPLAYFSLLIAIALVPFLICNLGFDGARCKVFMGDSGSMFIGLAVVWLLVVATQHEHEFGNIKPVTALWLVALPIMDIVSVMARRILAGDSPIKAGRDHIHHFYLRAGFNSRHTLFLLLAFTAVMQMVGVMGDLAEVPDFIMFITFIVTYFAYLLHLKWLQLRAKKLNLKVHRVKL